MTETKKDVWKENQYLRKKGGDGWWNIVRSLMTLCSMIQDSWVSRFVLATFLDKGQVKDFCLGSGNRVLDCCHVRKFKQTKFLIPSRKDFFKKALSQNN